MPALTRLALICAAGLLTLSLLLHYDYGLAVVNYTGPPVPLAVRVPPACPVGGHAVVDGQLVPVRCGYVIHCYAEDPLAPPRVVYSEVVHDYVIEFPPAGVYADRPVPPNFTWVLLVGDSAMYALVGEGESGTPLTYGASLVLPRGASYILFNGTLYALFRAPDVEVGYTAPAYVPPVARPVRGVGQGAVHVLMTDARRAVPVRARALYSMYLPDRVIPVYVVEVRLERASLELFVNLTAHVAPDAWPILRPRMAAG
jgi:hypothetical protein